MILMNECKRQAIEIIDHLHQENRMDNGDYAAVHDGLTEIEPLRDRDEVLEELWEQFGAVPMNPGNGMYRGAIYGLGRWNPSGRDLALV